MEEQFRLERLQVYNWGTFQNYHDIPIAREGFLFVGASGSGKTTLLDAMSTMLNPHASTEYNTAARDAKRNDRTLLSYVRGAWAAKTSEESGEIVTDFLRKGTTWSAISMTYKKGPEDEKSLWGRKIVTLLQLFWVVGNTNTGLRRHYLITERNLDLDSLKFGTSLDIRSLRKDFPDDYHSREFGPYSERMRRLLGIESDNTLKLLQKTQSMKNIENLETFLKEYMLDKPKTFAMTDEMISEFGNLNSSHEKVVKAADQIKVLDLARKAYNDYQENEKWYDHTYKLKIHLRSYIGLKRTDLLKIDIKQKEAQKVGIKEEVKLCEEIHSKAEKDLAALEKTRYEKGGEAISRLSEEIDALKIEEATRGKAKDDASDLCKKLGFDFPETPEEFGLLLARGVREREEIQRKNDEEQINFNALSHRKWEKEKDLKKYVDELEVLEKQSSNIPKVNLELRNAALKALNMEEEDLPFMGELLDVIPSERHWQGAIERAYKDLALAVVVEDDKGKIFSDYLNASNLKGSFAFIRKVNNNFDSLPSLSPDLLSQKLEIKKGNHYVWLERELRRAYDYHCVESTDEFTRYEYSVTLNGSVKRGRTFYEKDDSYDLADKTKWVIGFDNRDKLALYRKLADKCKAELDDLNNELSQKSKERKLRDIRDRDCEKLSELSFERINVKVISERIAAATQRKKELEDDPELKNLEVLIAKQTTEKAVAFNKLVNANRDLAGIERDLTERNKELVSAIADYSGTVPHDVSSELDKIISTKFSKVPDLSNIYKIREIVKEHLDRDLETFRRQKEYHEAIVLKQFSEFTMRWPMESSDQGVGLDSASEFMAKLDRLEREELPNFENDFFGLLNKQSVTYATQIHRMFTSEVDDILERLEEVNNCLSGVPFNYLQKRPTFLKVKTNMKNNQDLTDFKRRLLEVSSHSMSQDRSMAEYRFNIQKGIVEDLVSQEKDKILWRESVIDVRNHLEFIGVELDEDDNEVESYRSGSGKSGGQRQKLAATCLAAALRYQLGGRDLGYPAFGTVVFDEAFAKTDNEHTKLAMEIFKKLGFQLVMATPNKGVIVAEPYIGGAAYIYINNRDSSYASPFRYDKTQSKLVWPKPGESGFSAEGIQDYVPTDDEPLDE
jgi:uncharacterized protein YPO0396